MKVLIIILDALEANEQPRRHYNPESEQIGVPTSLVLWSEFRCSPKNNSPLSSSQRKRPTQTDVLRTLSIEDV
ncbi:hypothetical protein Y032_0001g477 [Ancylostoma ceylanicum]|uniref:Uncharacterized protein n=1 Tax=Ancylostoma ceylanicum TaxID=53326 RepID=A0A016W432_9BILA|nr:hypothetical protein Y032_0001g477 [Ancylostoma ceylanicum]